MNSNMILNNSKAINNSAIIGGFIHYTEFIPNFLLQNYDNILKSNVFIDNKAIIYGNNFGSMP